MAFGKIVTCTIGKSGESGKKIENLKIWFEVTKTLEKSANTAKIEIYNLSDDTIHTINVVGNSIILTAGYEDEGTSNLFFGKLSRGIRSINSTDKILTIEAYDGAADVNDSNISIVYDPNTLATTILRDVVSQIDIPLGSSIPTKSTKYYQGYSFIGHIKDALTEITKKLGLNWSIINNQIYIFADDDFLEQSAFVLNFNTGLLEEPELLQDQQTDQDIGTVPKRYNVKSLLIPQISPGSRIKIESTNVNGYFKVESSTYSGDNFDSDFISENEVVAI